MCGQLAARDVTDIGIVTPSTAAPFFARSGFGPDRLGSQSMVLLDKAQYRVDPLNPTMDDIACTVVNTTGDTSAQEHSKKQRTMGVVTTDFKSASDSPARVQDVPSCTDQSEVTSHTPASALYSNSAAEPLTPVGVVYSKFDTPALRTLLQQQMNAFFVLTKSAPL